MKNMLVAFYAAIIAFLIILIGFTIHGRSIRQVELDNALKSSMENAMTTLLYEEGKPQTEEKWTSDFIQAFARQINSNSDLEIVIIEADMEKGLLSVEATLTWYHPIGTKGRVSSFRTAILEAYETEN